jgi:hypothetical protein
MENIKEPHGIAEPGPNYSSTQLTIGGYLFLMLLSI